MELKKSRISGFYEERDGNGELVGISAMNMGSMCKEGECYEYQYGRIVRVCEYKSGEFVRVLKNIHGSTMQSMMRMETRCMRENSMIG